MDTPISKQLDSQTLKQSLFSQPKMRKSISDPIKLENGQIMFYQIVDFIAESKRPLQDVREQILTQLRAQQIQTKLENDCKHSVKALHNGTSIETFAKKFKTILQTRAASKLSASDLPASVLAASKRIPSSHQGWTKPILSYHAEDNSWYLLALKSVVYTDKNTASVEQIISDEAASSLLIRQELEALYHDILS